MGIEVTETAVREIKTIVEQQELDAEKVYLRLGVKGGGCSGFSYLLDLTEKRTESDEMFAGSLRLVEEAGLTWLHVFPYSPRDGTPAARMPQLERRLIRERAARLREAGDAAVRRFLDGQVDTQQEILVEKADSGRSAHYATVRLAGASPGTVLSARAIGHDGQMLIAEVAA